jgi:hypothetical protein
LPPRAAALLIAALVPLCWWTVYTRYFDLNSFDLATNQTFSALSLTQHAATLEGTRPFPYQWRMLASWVVWAGERATQLDPHLIDAALKTAALTASATFFFLFARTLIDAMGAVVATLLYLLATGAAFGSEGYAIYFTNDFLVLAGWCASVWGARTGRWAVVVAATFVSAWAKETALLALILVALEAWRGRAPWAAWAATAAAFVVPTALLRTWYPAPLSDWAWWDTAYRNVPFLARDADMLLRSLRENLKVALFLHVFWVLAFIGWRRSRDGFVGSLAVTLCCYFLMAWVVVYIRELRHMLPFTVLVLPLAVGEVQRLLAPGEVR